MAITLRENTSNNTGIGRELTYLEMDTNLESFYYSSSLNGTDLHLYTTGSISHTLDFSNIAGTDSFISSVRLVGTDLIFAANGAAWQGTIPLASFLDDTNTHIGNSNLTLSANRTLTLNTNDLTFAAANSSLFITDLATVEKSQILGYDATTGEVVAMNTSSLGAGGIDTQIQFNDGGYFNGDSGFTYNKTANRVTITAPSSPTRTAPNLLLNSEISNVVVDEVFGVIAANNTTGNVGQANYPASIQFTADSTFGPGNYDTRIGLFVNNNATETEALRLISTGQNRLPQYGSGTFTGTATKWLAVNSTGDVIEQDPPQDLSRPSTVDEAHTLVTVNGAQQWSYSTTPQTTSATSGNFYANSTTVASINYFQINYTSANAGNQFDRLKRLCESSNRTTSGRIVITDTTNGDAASATIKQVVDNGTFFTVAVTSWIQSGFLTTLVAGRNYDFDTDNLPLRVELLDKKYNRLTLNNTSGTDITARLFAPATASPGDYIVVELLSIGSNTNKIYLQYVLNNSGTLVTYDDKWNSIFVSEQTAANQELFITDNYQMAMLEFRVTPTGNLALVSADKVARPV